MSMLPIHLLAQEYPVEPDRHASSSLTLTQPPWESLAPARHAACARNAYENSRLCPFSQAARSVHCRTRQTRSMPLRCPFLSNMT